MTDELVIRPFPKSIVLDPGSFPLFPELAPPGGRRARAGPGRPGMAHRPSSGRYRRRADTGARWSCAPAGGPARRHGCTAARPPEAMQLLLGEAFDFSDGGQVVFDRLADLVETVPVYRLGYSDLREAVERRTRGLLVATSDSAVTTRPTPVEVVGQLVERRQPLAPSLLLVLGLVGGPEQLARRRNVGGRERDAARQRALRTRLRRISVPARDRVTGWADNIPPPSRMTQNSSPPMRHTVEFSTVAAASARARAASTRS